MRARDIEAAKPLTRMAVGTERRMGQARQTQRACIYEVLYIHRILIRHAVSLWPILAKHTWF